MNVNFPKYEKYTRPLLAAFALSNPFTPVLAHSNAATTYPDPVINQAIVYTTCHDTGDKLTPSAALTFAPLLQPQENVPCIFLDPTHRFQTIVGFGGAFTDSAAETFYKLSPDKQTLKYGSTAAL